MIKLKYLLFLAFIGFIISCDDDNDNNDNKDEHSDPKNWEFYQNGELIYTYDPSSNTDTFILDDNLSNGTVNIKFFDEDEIIPEDNLTLDWEITDQNIIEFLPNSLKYSFDYNITNLGITTVFFKLMHDGHSDLTTQAIELQVK